MPAVIASLPAAICRRRRWAGLLAFAQAFALAAVTAPARAEPAAPQAMAAAETVAEPSDETAQEKASPAPTAPGRTAAEPPASAAPNRLLEAPDPEPVVEPIRRGGPNKPYAVGDQIYVPDTGERSDRQIGLASFYAHKFHGRRTASGEVYNLWGMTAAHVTLPIPSYARVRNPKNGRSVIVRINDRGPFSRNRVIDLSWAAAAKLDLLRNVGSVEIERLTEEEIRSGQWKARAEGADAPVTYEIAGGERLGNANLAHLARFGPFAPAARQAARKDRTQRSTEAVAAAAPQAPSEAALSLALAATTAGAAGTDRPAAGAALKTLRSERAGTEAARGWWLQLGSFGSQDLADSFYQRLGSLLQGLDPLLAMFQETQQHKVQAGPFETREEAARFGRRLRELLTGLSPTLVERK